MISRKDFAGLKIDVTLTRELRATSLISFEGHLHVPKMLTQVGYCVCTQRNQCNLPLGVIPQRQGALVPQGAPGPYFPCCTLVWCSPVPGIKAQVPYLPQRVQLSWP